MISHRAVPYADALLRARVQDAALVTLLGLTLVAPPTLLLLR
jgi:hypothetical protein